MRINPPQYFTKSELLLTSGINTCRAAHIAAGKRHFPQRKINDLLNITNPEPLRYIVRAPADSCNLTLGGR